MGHLSNPALRGSLILIVLLPYAWSSPFLDLGLGDTSQGNNGIDFDASLAGSKSIHLGNERGNDIRPVVAQRPNIIVFDAPLTTPPPIVIVSPPIRPLPPPQQQPCVHPGPPPQYHHQPGHGPPPQQYHQQSGQGPPRHYRGLEVNSTNNDTAKDQDHPIQENFQVKEARSVVLENSGPQAQQYHQQPVQDPTPQQYHQQSEQQQYHQQPEQQQYHQQPVQGLPRHYRGLEVNYTNNDTAKNQDHPIQENVQVKAARSVVLENPGPQPQQYHQQDPTPQQYHQQPEQQQYHQQPEQQQYHQQTEQQQYHQQPGQGLPRHYRGLEVNSTNNVTAKNQSHPIQNIFQVKEARSVVLENPGAEAVHPVHLNSTYVNNTKAANETKSDRPVSPRLLGMANVYHRVFGGARK